jgi:thymidine kinase
VSTESNAERGERLSHFKPQLEVITGGMFSGKSEELMRRLRRADIAKQKTQAFKSAKDTRFSQDKLHSHSGGFYDPSTPVQTSRELLELVKPETKVVGIDEGHFFDDELPKVCEELVRQGKRVIVASLDMDFRGEPFGPIPELIVQAESVDKLHAVCTICGGPASRTQRLINGEPAHHDDPLLVVSTDEIYEARCRQHHQVPRDY